MRLLSQLIYALDDAGVITLPELLERIQVSEMDMVVIKVNRRVNYNTVAQYLKQFDSVFLEDCGKRKAHYATKTLEKKLGIPIKKVRAEFQGKAGYLLWVEKGSLKN